MIYPEEKEVSNEEKKTYAIAIKIPMVIESQNVLPFQEDVPQEETANIIIIRNNNLRLFATIIILSCCIIFMIFLVVIILPYNI